MGRALEEHGGGGAWWGEKAQGDASLCAPLFILDIWDSVSLVPLKAPLV